ncbi:2-oxo-4-hydroxy-4-carboxy-5-ureidoimidazoline decarboxylase [Orbus hercynius]|uniref:2-oxo-4-hydroxy-4-carboxy-5-ureidoimidazoline decarboxylase n=1 Tax=Orbus hercynius TaxID=593135 RepID=A0A495RC09_9GAMM|nr:2-oxo-4-hydroxy-4-carboxy-5-ureidoimidazoline decarboxylase [Orbus hercynius]RKS84806.1 2-oxo-4-hydroxy-4-carboxy-5-ureidoimidazoline decarboxylase [Orbus hercynius]
MKFKFLSIALLFLPLTFNAMANVDNHHRIQDINKMDDKVYLTTFSPLFNDDEWVLVESGKQRPFSGFVDMFEHIINIIKVSDKQTQLSLIADHPDLACPAARTEGIAAASQEEQKSSGLNSCTQEEAVKLTQLNKQYREKFGFPFLLAVKGYDKAAIFAEIEDRLNNDQATEFNIAMQQYYKVVMLRMLDLVK